MMRLLLIEDDEVDVMALRRSLATVDPQLPLSVAGNGQEGLHALRDQPGGAWVVLLDLNLPRMGGLDFLLLLRGDARLRHIPVVVMTTSRDDRDLRAAFALNVAGYFVKPMASGDFLERIALIHRYWSTSELL